MRTLTSRLRYLKRKTILLTLAVLVSCGRLIVVLSCVASDLREMSLKGA